VKCETLRRSASIRMSFLDML